MKAFIPTIVLAAALALLLAPTSTQARPNASRRVQPDGSNAAVGRSAKRSLRHNPATATQRRLAKHGKSSRESNEGVGLQQSEFEVHAYIADPTPEAEDIQKSSFSMPMQMSIPFVEMGLGLELPMSMPDETSPPAETDNELDLLPGLSLVPDEDITTTSPTESETTQTPKEASESLPSSTSASDTTPVEAPEETEVPEDEPEEVEESSEPTTIDTINVQKMTNSSDIRSTLFITSLFGALIMMW